MFQIFSSFKHRTISLLLPLCSLFLGTLYRSPASSVQMFVEDFLSYISFLLSLSFLVVCGDFNIHVAFLSSLVLDFKSVVGACCLTQPINFHTHLHGHTLDSY